MKKLIIIAFVAASVIAACGGKKNAAKPAATGSGDMGSADMSGHDMGSGSGSGSGSEHDADGHKH